VGRRLLLLVPIAVFAAVGGFFLWGLLADRDPSAIPSMLIDRPAPDFALAPPPGVDVPGLTSEDLKGNGVTIVNIFASWCLPCRIEHPVLEGLSSAGNRVVGIDYKDKPADLQAYLRELGNPYQRIGGDQNGRAGIDWGISGVPETFIVDGQGKVRYRHVGPINPGDLEGRIQPVLDALKRAGG